VPDVTSPTRFAIFATGLAVIFSSLTVAAQTAPPSPIGPQQPGQPMTFDQFKAQQLQQLQRAQARLAQRLAAPDLPADEQQRLGHRQAELGKFAAMPPDQQDQILHRRFDRIDTNHDGVIDPGELQAFRQQQREQAEAKKSASGPGDKNDDFWPSQN
jgi:EF hand domain-containing protein